jgi:hypothetical protein
MTKTNLDRRCEIEAEWHAGDRAEPGGWSAWSIRRNELAAELRELEKLPPRDPWRPADPFASMRDDSGKLPGVSFPGGYSINYLMEDGDTLCAPCANGDNGSDAYSIADDEREGDGWRVVAHFVHWEGPEDYCAHCDATLASEYGDPDES